MQLDPLRTRLIFASAQELHTLVVSIIYLKLFRSRDPIFFDIYHIFPYEEYKEYKYSSLVISEILCFDEIKYSSTYITTYSVVEKYLSFEKILGPERERPCYCAGGVVQLFPPGNETTFRNTRSPNSRGCLCSACA